MTTTVYTPKQIAKALGVSESSVKRWVDSGKLVAAKTVGGHRKVPLTSIVHFVRETGQQLVEPAVVGLVKTQQRDALETSRGELFAMLIDGQENACRELLLGCYQRGESINDLGDRLIGPVFQQIGHGWAGGTVSVHQERRSCEVMIATLHELRRWLPRAADDAPLAVVAAPEQDFAEVPPRLVELVLAERGWRVIMAGSGLPLEEVRKVAIQVEPRLVCVSATHLSHTQNFAAALQALLVEPLHARFGARDDGFSCRVVVGGTASLAIDSHLLDCDLVAASLTELADYQRTLT